LVQEEVVPSRYRDFDCTLCENVVDERMGMQDVEAAAAAAAAAA
jgi:hypothetical protein